MKTRAQRAVHLFVVRVTGETSTPEYQPLWNKLYAGIHGGLPIVAGIDLSEHEKTVVEQMLMASSAIGAFWEKLDRWFAPDLLVREGQLSYDEESWHLRIPTRPLITLLDRLPWSFFDDTPRLDASAFAREMARIPKYLRL